MMVILRLTPSPKIGGLWPALAGTSPGALAATSMQDTVVVALAVSDGGMRYQAVRLVDHLACTAAASAASLT